METDKSLPHLCYILVCERATEREDGRLDLEGVLNRLLYMDMPIKMPPMRLPLRVIVSMYSEDSSAAYDIRYTLVTPDGTESELGTGKIGNLGGQYHSIMESFMELAVNTVGTYWIKAYLGSRLWGQYPVVIAYLQMSNS
jgi:hypothetical protein